MSTPFAYQKAASLIAIPVSAGALKAGGSWAGGDTLHRSPVLASLGAG